jgi:hypothetical protein
MRRASVLIAVVAGCMVPVEPAESPDEIVEPAPPPAAAVVPARDETPLEAALREHQEFLQWRKVPPPHTRKERREHRRTIRTITTACLEGQRRAEEDLAQGYLARAQFGLMADCFDRYARAAADRYGVGFHLMGCVIDDQNGPLAGCYNHVMDREITRRHGADALDKLWHEVCDED